MKINQWHLFLWRVNRSPLKWMIKFILKNYYRSKIKDRKSAFQNLKKNKETTLLLENFVSEGYVSLDHLIDVEKLNELSLAASKKLNQFNCGNIQGAKNHKNFWVRLLDEDMVDGMLPVDNPFVQFALQPQIIRFLCEYLGDIPYLDYVLLTLSTKSKQELSYSQLWHKDHDDIRVIKLFVYLTDVNSEKDGPFTLLSAESSKKVGFSLKSHREDKDILRYVSSQKIKSIKGKRLTVFMVETSKCFHMGSRITNEHSRLLYTATFITVPRIFPEPNPRFILTGTEDDLTYYVLNTVN